MKLPLPHLGTTALILPIAALAAFSGVRALAEGPSDGDTIDFESGFDPARVTTQHCTASVVDSNGGHALKIEFEPMEGYPAAQIAAPSGGWNLSKYNGVEAELTNVGDASVTIALRVDNAGKPPWTEEPWNVESITLKPGDTQSLQVTFGHSYGGQKGYDLDPTAIVRIVVFAVNPGEGAAITVDNIKGSDPK